MNYSSKDISTIIPAYNCENHILKALDSVFEQSDLPGQVIVVNDGSEDRTEEVILSSKYAEKIDYYCIKNCGPGGARNFGLQKAKHSWIAFLDSDDVWVDRNKLRGQVALINEKNDAVLVDGFSEVNWGKKRYERNKVKNGDCSKEFHLVNAVNATSSVIALKSALLTCGGFNPSIRFGEDRLLWLALSYIGKVYTYKEIVVRKVNSEGNLTSFYIKNFNQRLLFLNEMLSLIKANETITKSYEKYISFKNVEHFFKVAIRNNNVSLFDKVFKEATSKSLLHVSFSIYFLFNLYRKIFGTFFPISTKKKK